MTAPVERRQRVVDTFDQNQTARMRELLNEAVTPTKWAAAYTLAPSAGATISYAASTLR